MQKNKKQTNDEQKFSVLNFWIAQFKNRLYATDERLSPKRLVLQVTFWHFTTFWKNKNLWQNSNKLRIWDKTDSKRFIFKN